MGLSMAQIFRKKKIIAPYPLAIIIILGGFFLNLLLAQPQREFSGKLIQDWQIDLLLKYNFFYDSGEWNVSFTVGNKSKTVAYRNIQVEVVWPGMQIPEIFTLTYTILPRKSIKFSGQKPGPLPQAMENQSTESNPIKARIIGAEPEPDSHLWPSSTEQDKELNPATEGETGVDKSAEVIFVPDNQRPKVIRGIKPKYPSVALRARIMGTVIIEVTIDENGRVKAAKIVQGQPLLNVSALKAVKNWIFAPYEVDDIPTPARFNVQVTFELER